MRPSSVARQLTPSARVAGAEEQRAIFAGRRYEQIADLPTEEPELAEAADLYYRRLPRGLTYRHFDSATAAIRFAHESLSALQVGGAVLQVGEQRFEGAAVAAMVRRLGPPRKESHQVAGHG